MSSVFERAIESTPEEYADRVSKMDDKQLIGEHHSTVYSAKTRNYLQEDAYNQATKIVEDELLKRLKS